MLLLAIVGGVTSVTGAALGRFLLMLLPVLQSEVPALGGLVFLVIGLAAVSLGRDSNGIASRVLVVGRLLRRVVRLPRRPAPGVQTREVTPVAAP